MTPYEEADARLAAAALNAMDARTEHGEDSVPYAEASALLDEARKRWVAERAKARPRSRRAA